MDNHVWAVPLSVESSSVFFYNQTLFNKLSLGVPTTFAQMVQAASVIKSKSNVAPLVEGGKDTCERWPEVAAAWSPDSAGTRAVRGSGR